MRARRAVTSLVLVLGAVAALPGTATAAAPASCAFDDATRVLTVSS